MAVRRLKETAELHIVRSESLPGTDKPARRARLKAPRRALERRKSVSAPCLKCGANQTCPLARASWFHQICVVRIHGRDTILVRQGQNARVIQVIRRGWVQASHVMPNGKSISEFFGPGNPIGIMSAMTRECSPYTATALEECEVEQADAAAVLKNLRHDPGTTLDLLRYSCQQALRMLDLFYVAAGKVPSEARLMDALQAISAARGLPVDDGTRINMPLTVQVLADRIGCSRQWASKLLGQLARRGAIKRHGPWITILGSPHS
jgi:CRP-like cAMP-binding protein